MKLGIVFITLNDYSLDLKTLYFLLGVLQLIRSSLCQSIKLRNITIFFSLNLSSSELVNQRTSDFPNIFEINN